MYLEPQMPFTTKSEATLPPSPHTASLQIWHWRSYLRAALIPLLVIELSFLGTYWISSEIVYSQNADTVSELSHRYLGDIVRREAATIDARLGAVSTHTQILARQTLTALNGDYVPPQSERDRYVLDPVQGLYTASDNGTTSSWYSAAVPIGQMQMSKVWKLAALDSIMMDIARSNPLIASIYFNSYDGYNRMFPYIDVRSQYQPEMDIPAFNFYYEADATHNPRRSVVWTDAYIDPAGHGWMVSSIAPVWNGDRLEGVVGIDITLQNIIDQLLNLDIPWGAYAILVDENGVILAMPSEGEADFDLEELTNHDYLTGITSDVLKPEDFNINQRSDTQTLAAAMSANADGEAVVEFDGEHIASFATIARTGWRLVIIAPRERILADARGLRDRLQWVGYVMFAMLLVFYIAFFGFLLRRARQMSALVAEPVQQITSVVERIGRGEYDQEFYGSQVEELNRLGEQIVSTGRELGAAEEEVVRQRMIAEESFVKLEKANEETVRFARLMSHQIRTPLSVIDSSAQIIERKAEVLGPLDLKARSSRLRVSVKAISELLETLLGRLDLLAGASPSSIFKNSQDLISQVANIARSLIPEHRLQLGVPPLVSNVVAPDAYFDFALREIIDNAMRHGDPSGAISVTLEIGETQAVVTVINRGLGIPDGELKQIGDRFFRGTSVDATEGLGMGFHLARAFLEKHGGRISISSEDGLTSVEMQLPIAATPAVSK